MTVEFHSAHFELQHGKATLVRQPSAPQVEGPWATAAVELKAGSVKDITYDGVAGRIHLWCENLQVRRRSDGRAFLIPILAAIHDLTEDEVRADYAVVELGEHLVVVLQVVDSAHRPLPNAELSVLSALPESVSIGGRTTADGEFLFLARTGMYSIVMGERRHPPINIGPTDAGEHRVIVSLEARQGE